MGPKNRLLIWTSGLVLGLLILGARGWLSRLAEANIADVPDLQEVEIALSPLAQRLGPPQPGDWLEKYKEPGQTFAEYVHADPVRRTTKQNTIYVCQIGDFSKEQNDVMERTREYLSVFFDVPVKTTKNLPLSAIPPDARRTHPTWGDKQVLTGYVLDQVLLPNRPDDALASLAFTATDLWPGDGWNFLFGQAQLRERVGVWSIYRNGDPAKSKEGFQLCLRRTFKIASHETGHILTMHHCTAYACNLNGCNNREESDRQPMHLCPVCLRKLCWNLQVEPVPYLEKLRAFCETQGLDDEVRWYRSAIQMLKRE